MKHAVVKVDRQLPAVAAIGSAASLIQAIERAASNPKADIEKMERLFAMHQKMVAADAEAQFNAAMARVQARIMPIAHNADNDQTHSRYAKLAAINKAIVPIYSGEGLSISFDTGEAKRPEWFRISAKVSHAAGHTREYHMDLPSDGAGFKGTANKTEVHAAGSTNSYGRRYLTCMIFNIATEDDDGNGAGKAVGLDEGVIADHLAAMEAAADVSALHAAFGRAYKAATSIKDRASERTFIRAKDARKKALGVKP